GNFNSRKYNIALFPFHLISLFITKCCKRVYEIYIFNITKPFFYFLTYLCIPYSNNKFIIFLCKKISLFFIYYWIIPYKAIKFIINKNYIFKFKIHYYIQYFFCQTPCAKNGNFH